MWSKNKIVEKLARGEVPLGLEVMLGSARIIEIAGWSGFDFVQLDQEHTSFGLETLEDLIRAADATGMTAILRVAKNDAKDIGRALETGAHGVIIPQVIDAEDVQSAIDACFYAPRGKRGMCPVTRAARYNEDAWGDYNIWLQSEVLLIPLIENESALNNIEEICALPEVKMIGFGAGDLGQSLGFGARGLSEPAVRDAFKHVSRVAKKHNVALKGMPVIGLPPREATQNLIDMGVDVVIYDADALMLSREFRRIAEGVEGLKPSSFASAA
ncbi:aldolase/citrate lyase family protein [Paracoccus sp. PXZ]